MALRVTSEFWVSALRRRCEKTGSYVVVIRKGAVEAGAIFIASKEFGGLTTLYGPAPQILAAETRSNDRVFESLGSGMSDPEVQERLAKEFAFDPDGWVIEIEGRMADDLFEVVET